MKALGKRSIASMLKVWLEITWWLMWVAATGVVLVLAYTLVSGNPTEQFMKVPVAFDLDASAYEIISEDLEVSRATIRDAGGTLYFNSPNARAMLAYLAIAIAYGIVVLVVIFQLRKIFRALVKGRPFNMETASRIRVIGLFAIFGEVAVSLVEYLCQHYVGSKFDTTGLSLQPDIGLDFSTIFIGFVLLIVSEIFRIGTRMQEDQDLTV